MTAAMSKSTQSLFEAEMRKQVTAAEAAVFEALDGGDPLLVGAARGHLDGLIALAHRNGLEIVPQVPAEPTLPLDEAI
jgi:hypothetical protein